MAARSRAQSNPSEFWHWPKVASEIVRLSPDAKMDMTVVRTIVDEEMRNHHP
jgi:hypothetical protein